MDATAVQHFRQGLKALKQRRGELAHELALIDQQITSTEAFLSAMSGEQVDLVSNGTVLEIKAGRPAPSVREVVREVATENITFTFQQVRDRLAEYHKDVADGTISSVISREDDIEGTGRRGEYFLVTKSDTPGEPGVSVEQTTNSAAATVEHHEEVMEHGADRDDLRSAPVVGVS